MSLLPARDFMRRVGTREKSPYSSYETSRLSVIPSADKELTRNPPSAQYFNRHSRVGGNDISVDCRLRG